MRQVLFQPGSLCLSGRRQQQFKQAHFSDKVEKRIQMTRVWPSQSLTICEWVCAYLPLGIRGDSAEPQPNETANGDVGYQIHRRFSAGACEQRAFEHFQWGGENSGDSNRREAVYAAAAPFRACSEPQMP